MRIRSTKPEFWRSKTIAALPWDVRFVLKGLESYVDDNGVGKDDIALIAADVFPRDLSANPRETLARLSEAISALTSAGLVVRYEFDGDELIYIDRWKDIQRIDKPTRGRFRRPDGTLDYAEDVDRESYAKPREDFANTPEVLAPGTGEQGNRGTGEQSLSSGKPDKIDNGFAEFWDSYPRKIAKPAAEKAYRAALKRASAEQILDGLRRYRFRDDPEFIPHPKTWLNQDRWVPEQTGTVHQLRPGEEPSFTPEQLDDILGPDSESLPAPPPGVDPEIDHRAYQAWLREQREQRRAQRVQQAMERAGQR